MRFDFSITLLPYFLMCPRVGMCALWVRVQHFSTGVSVLGDACLDGLCVGISALGPLKLFEVCVLHIATVLSFLFCHVFVLVYVGQTQPLLQI